LWSTLQGARWLYLVPNILMVVGVMSIRAWRWQLILRPIARVPFARVYSSTMIGFMANNVLPARLGEIARAVSLGLKTGISRSARQTAAANPAQPAPTTATRVTRIPKSSRRSRACVWE